MRAATRTLLATLTAVALACGGGGDSTGPGGHSPAAIDRFAGDSQVAAAGTVLPESLAVRVTDAGGQPVAGTTVNWSVIGAGSVSPASSLTDAQ
ncbi:MAG TPA: Ig-like domain-containing protein, partial [Gemmatimonadales bacterium]|nr:Ig-like domain-containing protein [Gemmatimonadales bacterium]